MDFKIDTRDTFSVISPETDLITVILTDALEEYMDKIRQSGSSNFIIDLSKCANIEPEAVLQFAKMHEDCYDRNNSLVLTGLQARVLNVFKENEVDLLINIAPKMIEAIDIISMEILERDLWAEGDSDDDL
jgi:anti-anti-sigma regulatory factor